MDATIATLTEAALSAHRGAGDDPAYDDLGGFVVDALVAAVANAGGIPVALNQWQQSPASGLVRDLVWQTVGDPSRLWGHRTTPLRVTIDVDTVVADHHPATHAAWQTAVAHADDRVQAIAQPDITAHAWVYDRTDDGGFVARDDAAPAWSWELWREQPLPVEWSELDLDDFEQTLRLGLRPRPASPGEPVGAHVLKDVESASAWAAKVRQHDEWVTTFERLRTELLEERRRAWTSYGGLVAARLRSLAVEVPGLSVPIDVDVVADPRAAEGDPWPLPPQSLEAELLEQAVRDVEPPPPPF